jgi:hypothetical protein
MMKQPRRQVRVQRQAPGETQSHLVGVGVRAAVKDSSSDLCSPGPNENLRVK